MKCPYCGNDAQWVENKVIYGRNYGKSYMIWLCEPCDAHVGCHGNTQVPLGTMANAELRSWRQKTHSAIDPLWQDHKMTRQQVYSLMRSYFGKEVHIGEADVDMCKRIIAFASGVRHGKIGPNSRSARRNDVQDVSGRKGKKPVQRSH